MVFPRSFFNGPDETAECYRKRFNTDGLSGMIDMDTSTSEMLTKKYIQYYHMVREYFKCQTGKYPKEYREDIDQDGIEKCFQGLEEEGKTIKEVAVEMLNKLISLQALPNMNHRTTFTFVRAYLHSNDVYLYEYEDRKWEYLRFTEESKHAIMDERSLIAQMGGADEETRNWLVENCLGEHLAITTDYFDELVQSGNPIIRPRTRLKEAFSVGDNL